jgi:hypothetical protein
VGSTNTLPRELHNQNNLRNLNQTFPANSNKPNVNNGLSDTKLSICECEFNVATALELHQTVVGFVGRMQQNEIAGLPVG